MKFILFVFSQSAGKKALRSNYGSSLLLFTDNDKDHGAVESREVRFHSSYTMISIIYMRNLGSSVEVW